MANRNVCPVGLLAQVTQQIGLMSAYELLENWEKHGGMLRWWGWPINKGPHQGRSPSELLTASEVLVVYNYVSNEHYSCIWQKQQLLKLYFTVVYQLSYRLGAFTL